MAVVNTEGGERRANQTVLPLFEESNLPSASQDALAIAVVDSNGDIKLGIAGNNQWYLFNFDSTKA